MGKTAQTLRVLLPLLLVSCMRERPRDLRLERVYIADISGTSIYNPPIGHEMRPPPPRLAIELSTTETFPLGARMIWGFCGRQS
jgi:KaiC/GvpD/RAD55 family RecA-like ATPase